MMVCRQTTDEVDIEGLGRCKLTWNNGPAYFVPEGTSKRLDVQFSGFGKVLMENGKRLDVTILKSGDRHRRVYSPMFGEGWLVSETVCKKDVNDFYERFEDEDGNVKVRFRMTELCVGRPEYAQKMKRSVTRMPKIDDPDECNWTTYTSYDGSVLTFRKGGAPPTDAIQEAPKHVRDLFTSAARKRYESSVIVRRDGTRIDPKVEAETANLFES